MSKVFNNVMATMQHVASLRHVSALRDGVSVATTPMLIGSLFLIIRFLPIEAYANYMDSHLIGRLLIYPIIATMDMLAIFVLIGVTYRLADSYKVEVLGAIITAVASYMLVNPMNVLANIPSQLSMPISMMNSKSLFVAIIVAILSVEIYRKIIETNIVIKMPSSVPPAVSGSLVAVIPTLFVLISMLVIRFLFENTSYGTLNIFIEKMIANPLNAGLRSIFGSITHQTFSAVLFYFGLHGAMVDAVYLPSWIAINDENRMAFQAGLELPNVMTQYYLESFVKIGGTGSTMALVLLSIFFAKSSHIKQIGKLSFAPALFHINEPIIFGVPVVLNPIMLIPFITVPAILSTFSYICVMIGLVAKPTGVVVPWTMPTFFNAYIISNGDFRSIILQVVCLIIAIIIYYPFFKLIDKDYLGKEVAK